MAILRSCLAFVLVASCWTQPLSAAPRSWEAEDLVRDFLGRFLTGEDASSFTDLSVDPWIDSLHAGLGGDGPITSFRILGNDRSSDARLFAVLVGRGERTNAFYVEVGDDGKIRGFASWQQRTVQRIAAARKALDRAAAELPELADLGPAARDLMRALQRAAGDLQDWTSTIDRQAELISLERKSARR